MDISKIEIKKLKKAKYNPRTINEKELKGLKNSLKKFGFVNPVVVNKNYTIIGGHQRVKAWEELGNDIVPCIKVDLDEKNEKKLNIVLNSHSISGSFNQQKLNKILFEFTDDLDFNDLNLDDLMENIGEIELEKKTETLKPYEYNHVLISIPVAKNSQKIKEILDLLKKEEGVEIEQSNN